MLGPAFAGAPNVFLYYWAPVGSSVGHVALHLHDDTDDVYISFWPEKHDALMHNLLGYRGVWHASLLEDRQHEDFREPSAFDMSGLDEAAIKRFFLGERNRPLKWGLLHGDTCVSVASNALRAGGLGVATCRGSVPSCRRDLERSYVQYLKAHPRSMAAIAGALPAAMSAALPPATAQTSAVARTAYIPPAQAAAEPAGAYIDRAARAAPPSASGAPAPTAPSPVSRSGCPVGYRRDPDDGECYPREMYQPPGSGTTTPGSAPKPTDFGSGEPLKSR